MTIAEIIISIVTIIASSGLGVTVIPKLFRTKDEKELAVTNISKLAGETLRETLDTQSVYYDKLIDKMEKSWATAEKRQLLVEERMEKVVAEKEEILRVLSKISDCDLLKKNTTYNCPIIAENTKRVKNKL